MIAKELIRKTVDFILDDHSQEARDFLVEDLIKRIEFVEVPQGHNIETIVTAAIFLSSKCQVNLDKPLKFATLNNKNKLLALKENPRRNIWRKQYSLSKGVKLLKESGVFPEICIVTPLMILTSRREEFIDSFALDPRDYVVFLEHMKRFDQDRNFKRIRTGKDPYGMSAGLFYLFFGFIHRDSYILTQEDVERTFKVATQTIRNRYKELWDEFIDDPIFESKVVREKQKPSSYGYIHKHKSEPNPWPEPKPKKSNIEVTPTKNPNVTKHRIIDSENPKNDFERWWIDLMEEYGTKK